MKSYESTPHTQPEIIDPLDQAPTESTVPLIVSGLYRHSKESRATREHHLGSDRYLTAEEEIALSLAVQEGKQSAAILDALDPNDYDYLNLSRSARNDVRTDLRAHIDKVVAGRNARNTLIECNLQFAAEQARRSMNIVNPPESSTTPPAKKGHARPAKRKGMDPMGSITSLRSKHASLQDRVQIAYLGLINAAEKYKPTAGRGGKTARFTTFAAWQIHSTLRKEIPDTEFSGLRLPTYIHDFVRSVRSFPEQYSTEEHDTAAYYEQLYYGESLDELDLGLGLDEEVSSNWDSATPLETHEIVADYQPNLDIMTLLEAADVRALTVDALDSLHWQDRTFAAGDQSARDAERQIGTLRLRYGLTDETPHTFDEIGQVYGVTRERVRQIASKALSRMRQPERAGLLRDYADGIDDTDLRYPAQQHADATGTLVGLTTVSLGPKDLRDQRGPSETTPTSSRLDEDRESWQAYPDEPWEITELPHALDYEQVRDRLSASLMYLPVHEFSNHDTLSTPTRAIANILRETKGQLTAGHIEEYWNSRLTAFIKQLDTMTEGRLNHDSIGLLMSGLLAETMTDEDVITLTVPPALAGKLNFIGTHLTNGTLEINGDLGDYAGHAMGDIANLVVHGSVGDHAASDLSGMTNFIVDGDAGKHFANGATSDVTIRVRGTIESVDFTPGFDGELTAGNIKKYNVRAKNLPSPLSK